MNPAPTVAISTPQYSALRGAWSLIHRVSTAVITTYSEVRKADVDGLMSLSATIWLTKPTSMSPPSTPPPFHISGRRRPTHALGNTTATNAVAIRKRSATK